MGIPTDSFVENFGNAVGQANRNIKDRSTLDNIFKQVNESNDPAAYDMALQAILMNVSPERRQDAATVLQEKYKRKQGEMQRGAAQQYYKSRGIDPSLASAPEYLQKEAIKNIGKSDDKQKAFKTTVDLLKRAREIAGTGHLGPVLGVLGTGRNWGSTTSPEGQRLRAEYQQIGKALVQAAAPLKITNRTEFEHYARDLENPTRTLEEISGTLDALERIISSSSEGEDFSQSPALERNYANQKSQATGQSVNRLMRDAQGNEYDIPAELYEQALEQGLR